MAIYNQERIIKEYYEKVKHLYPNITFERFEETCKFPGYFIKFHMKSGKLPTIMVKYLGKFIVYPARVKCELESQRIFFEGKKITEEEYIERKDMMEKFLVNFSDGYNTYELEDDTIQTEATN